VRIPAEGTAVPLEIPHVVVMAIVLELQLAGALELPAGRVKLNVPL